MLTKAHNTASARPIQCRGASSGAAASMPRPHPNDWNTPGKYDFDTIESEWPRSTSQMMWAGITVSSSAAPSHTRIDLEKSSFRKSMRPGDVRSLAPAGTPICRPELRMGWEKSKDAVRCAVIEMAPAAASARPSATAVS